MKKKYIILFITILLLSAIIVPTTLFAVGIIDYATPMQSSGKYLMTYFVGNEPSEEAVRYALSNDGYNFIPLNNNNAIITQQLGTKSCRDPYITKDKNNKYHLICTDMRSENGWSSNSTFVLWESNDLITWTNERIIDINNYLEGTVRAWAPQILWIDELNAFMVYWANAQIINGLWTKTVMWHALLNESMTDLQTQPQILYAPSNGNDAIDGDIIKQDDIYYMYYKDETKKSICYVTSTSPQGPYVEPTDNKVSLYNTNVEGNFIYRLVGSNTYLMMIDCYSKGKFVIQQTSSPLSQNEYKRVKPSNYSLDFSPRHGSVIAISDSEYQLIYNTYN